MATVLLRALTSPLNRLASTGAERVPGSEEAQRTAEGQQKQDDRRQGQSKWTASRWGVTSSG